MHTCAMQTSMDSWCDAFGIKWHEDVTNENVYVGALVVPGKDWKWNTQGEGTVGVVKDINVDGYGGTATEIWIAVDWPDVGPSLFHYMVYPSTDLKFYLG